MTAEPSPGRTQHLKAALAAPEPLIGLICNLASPYALEVVAGAGFDWLLVDTEHTPADLENVLHQLQVLAAHPVAPVVRVPWNDTVAIKRYLDVGARSLLIPYVESAEQAKAAVAATRYPPEGVRGVALATRASGFGRNPDYASTAHQGITIIAQIENQPGLEAIESIAAVDGIDALLLGPSDLHASFGHVGMSDHPDVIARIDDAIGRIVASGKTAGVFTGSPATGRRWIELGARLILVGTDISILAKGSDALVETYREAHVS